MDRELEAPLPGCCPHCRGDVAHGRDAEQWQLDLGDLAAVVTRFRVGVERCRSCRRRVQGRHLEQTSDALGAAGSQAGPKAKAWAAWLHYRLGLSFAKCSEVLGRLGIDVTRAALCSAAQSTGTALVPVHNGIMAHINASPVTVMNETGWRINGETAWLWVATTPEATAYNIAEGRSFNEACEVVGADYSGVIVRDGWAPYRSYTTATHQTCLAHIMRRSHDLICDLPAWARHTPRVINDLLHEALAARDLNDNERAEVIADLAERVELLGEQPQAHDENR